MRSLVMKLRVTMLAGLFGCAGDTFLPDARIYIEPVSRAANDTPESTVTHIAAGLDFRCKLVNPHYLLCIEPADAIMVGGRVVKLQARCTDTSCILILDSDERQALCQAVSDFSEALSRQLGPERVRADFRSKGCSATYPSAAHNQRQE